MRGSCRLAASLPLPLLQGLLCLAATNCPGGQLQADRRRGRRKLVESDVMEQRRRAEDGRHNTALGAKCRNENPGTRNQTAMIRQAWQARTSASD